MPNWCENEFKIEGKREDIERFKCKAEDEEQYLSFNKFLPIPENVDSVDWCRKNWGTKWDAVNVERVEHNMSIKYCFDTAWTPPKNVVKKMSRMFSELRFELRYFEG